MSDDPENTPEADPGLSRRQFLQLLLAAGGAAALPALWTKPVVAATPLPTTDLLSNTAGYPTGLAAATQLDGSVALTWVDHANNEDGYEVTYTDDPSFRLAPPSPYFTGTVNAGVGINGQGAFVFTTAVHAYPLPTTLHFKVRAYHAGTSHSPSTAYSGYSNPASATLGTSV